MFKAFNVELTPVEMMSLPSSGQSILASKKVDQNKLKEVLRKIINGNSISVSEIEATLFPNISTHVFISHSHADIKDVARLSNFLSTNFGIKSFVDSEFWGSVDSLINELIPHYAMHNPDIIKKYTSNAYMTLAMALVKVMDKTECVFFLNTSNSTTHNVEVAKIATKSPWICLELLCTQILRRQTPNRLRTGGVLFDDVKARSQENFKEFLYDLDISHLVQLNYGSFLKWYSLRLNSDAEKNLDLLYRLTKGS